MDAALAALGASTPIVIAPMAGGPSTPTLVTAAARAGATGMLAGGYLAPAALRDQIHAVRDATDRFGVNLFAPNTVSITQAAYDAYAVRLAPVAARYDIDPTRQPLMQDDDGWAEKLQIVLDERVPIVSMTFGLPGIAVVDALHAAGVRVVQTVTRPDEAVAALEQGVDGLVVQSHEAGGHAGSLDPHADPIAQPLPALIQDVRARVELPIWAAGGIAAAHDVRAALDAGATATVIGTAVLRSPEAGTNATHRSALATLDRDTVVTPAFSGRPARGIRNAFIDELGDDAPLGYPAIHHLAGPVRRTASAAGDAEWTHLWAGTGYRAAADAPVSEIIARLSPA